MKKISGKWHKGVLPGEDGNAGRTLEELLWIKENNFKIPDYGEFQIKSQKMTTKSLVTIFHKEPPIVNLISGSNGSHAQLSWSLLIIFLYMFPF